MKVITAEEVHAALSYPALVDALQDAYGKPFSMPPRQVFMLDDDPGNTNAFANLPAWNDKLIGVKAFTYFPDNPQPEYKSIYAQILLFDREHGVPLALVDGTTVTLWRTAGISGLATRLLSREDSESLLMVGTGNLAPYIIRANLSVRPIKRVQVWGRSAEKADAVVAAISGEFPEVSFSRADDLAAACGEADVVVSATGAHEPLVKGEWIRPGTHTDFIGNHHADKRECDTDLVVKAKLYADSYVNAFKEAGEFLVPIAEGRLTKENIVGELAEMCAGKCPLRTSGDEVTLFKSVGMAMSDLVGAGLAFQAG
ncbi:MAG: ornithine cyclodeaminase family protein [Akkermansiaceae bacterium]|nr:ornithine cyclodeaminase family protein [Akkermansiaceae bacterium]